MAAGALRLEDRSLVPVELEPPQGVEDLFYVPGSGALTVGIFDPQHERAGRAVVSGTPGQQPVVERGPGAADVERPGW